MLGFYGEESLFSIITTIIMIAISLFTAISAIYIAFSQIKRGKNEHINNLAVEFVVDFILPFENFQNTIRNTFDIIDENDKAQENVRLLIRALKNINVYTEFRYWEQHKGDIENSLKKTQSDKMAEEEFACIYEFIQSARKFKSDIGNVQREMSEFIIGKDVNHTFKKKEIVETNERMIKSVQERIDNLPEKLNIKQVYEEMRRK